MGTEGPKKFTVQAQKSQNQPLTNMLSLENSKNPFKRIIISSADCSGH